MSIFFFDFFTVRRPLIILRKWSDSAMIELWKCIEQCRSRIQGKLIKKSHCCFILPYGYLTDFENITLIHTFTHLHYRHSCHIVSLEKRCLYRRSSSIFWEYRSMYIDTHFFWYLEEFEWEDLPIGHDDEIITCKRADIIQKLLIVSDLSRLVERNIMCYGYFLHWTGFHSLVTTKGFVRISHDKYYLDTRISYDIR